MMDCMMGGNCMMGMWGMLAMWLFWIVLIALLVWGLYRLIESRRSTPPGRHEAYSRESPHEVLDRRYAAGEISTEEYEEHRRKLRE